MFLAPPSCSVSQVLRSDFGVEMIEDSTHRPGQRWHISTPLGAERENL
jgi:hypothetical protein